MIQKVVVNKISYLDFSQIYRNLNIIPKFFNKNTQNTSISSQISLPQLMIQQKNIRCLEREIQAADDILSIIPYEKQNIAICL